MTTTKTRGSLSLALGVALVVMSLVLLALWQGSVLRGVRQDLKVANQRADQAAQALSMERAQRDLANRAVLNLTNQLDAQQENADAVLASLRRALQGTDDVRLPGRAGRVLRDIAKPVVPAVAAAPARAGEAAAQADPAAGDRAAPAAQDSVSCGAVAEWAAENMELVLKPNAIQLKELQAFYEEQRVLFLLNGGQP